MIIYARKDEVNAIIEKLEEIEENFWLQYKNRTKSNREFLEECFTDLYKKLYDLTEGKQMEIDYKENKNA